MSNKEIDYPFTAYPNYIIDEIMPGIDASAFKVLTVIIRKTCGFHKKYDRISLSQLESHTNLGRTTVTKALKILCDKQIIKKDSSGRINRYCLVNVKGEDKTEGLKSTTSTNYEQDGSKTEQAKVHKLNSSLVQNMNTQKKPIKENEINTTTKEGDVEEVCIYWNKTFDGTINPHNTSLKEVIKTRINEFSIDQLKRAIFNRSKSSYYKEQVPYLREDPKSFFNHEKTIKNDLNRNPENLFTYQQHIDMITGKGYNADDFIVRFDIQDKKGKPMRELISNG